MVERVDPVITVVRWSTNYCGKATESLNAVERINVVTTAVRW